VKQNNGILGINEDFWYRPLYADGACLRRTLVQIFIIQQSTMNKLSFWHKFAFIANICWLLTWVMKYYSIIPKGDLQSNVIIIGLVMANIVNGIVNLWTGLLLSQKKLPAGIPRWLMTVNFIFLVPQLYLFFK
jgi:hypothetical protein